MNISTATVITFKFKKPDGTVVSKTGSLVSGGTTGKCRYTSIANDIDAAGNWTLQVYIEMGATTKFHTSTAAFTVEPYYS